MKFDKTKVKKILCFKPRGIGDIVLSTIVLENLHSYFSSAEIDYLTEEFAKDALKNNPLVNKVLTIGRKYAYNILATSKRGEYHSAEHNLELLKPLGIPIISKNIHYYLNEEDNEFGKEFIGSKFSGNSTIFGVVPSGGWKNGLRYANLLHKNILQNI